MFQIFSTLLIATALFSPISSEKLYKTHKEAITAAREAISQTVGDGYGFNLMNAGNSGIQKIITINQTSTNYSMLFDVGTHYSFLFQPNCTIDTFNYGNNKNYFYTWQPKTFTSANLPDSDVAYLTNGNIQGHRANITWNIPGINQFTPGANLTNSTAPVNATFEEYTFFMASEVPSNLQQLISLADADGILGLGLNNGSCRFLEALVNASFIDTQTFSLFVTMDPNGVDVLSELIFDSNDTRYVNTSFTSFPVPDNSSWSITLDSVSLNDLPLTESSANGYFSSLINGFVVPENVFGNFIGLASNAGVTCESNVTNLFCQCPYGNYSLLPQLNFTIGGQNFTIDPFYYATYNPNLYYNSLFARQQQSDDDEYPDFSDDSEDSEYANLPSYLKGTRKAFIIEDFSGEDSWDDLSDYSNWGNGMYTYNYDPYWNYGYFYYSPFYYGWGYGGMYPFYGYGYPIIFYNYDYYTNNYNPNRVSSPGDVCVLNLFNGQNFNLSSSNDWILGLPFLQSYYTVFSSEGNLTVSLAKSNQPFHFWVDNVQVPSKSGGSHWLLYIFIALVVILVAGVLFNWCQRNCKNNGGWSNNRNGNGNGERKKKKGKKGKRKNHHNDEDTETVIVTSGYAPPQNFYGGQFGNNLQGSNVYGQPTFNQQGFNNNPGYAQPYGGQPYGQPNYGQQPMYGQNPAGYPGYQPNAYQQRLNGQGY